MPANAPPKILILDDEFARMKALCDTLQPEGYAPTGFTSAADALNELRAEQFDLVLTDLMMPQMDGVEFLRIAQEADPSLVGIIMTGHAILSTAVQAMKTGALDCILKPFTLSAVKAIYMSGYTGDGSPGPRKLNPRIPLIEKPFRSALLLEKVREVLDADTLSVAACG